MKTYGLLLIILIVACTTKEEIEKEISLSIASPDNSIVVNLYLDSASGEKSPLYYSVLKDGKTILERSVLGIETDNNSSLFDKGLKIVNVDSSQIDETYQMPTGKRRENHNYAHEKIWTLINSKNDTIQVTFRAYNDGIGFRYSFPGKNNLNITAENSEFKLPEGTTSWIMTWNKAYEWYYTHRVVDTMPDRNYLFPGLFQTPGKQWFLLSEAAVYDNYPASSLQKPTATSFQITFPDERIPVNADFKSPWRMLIIGNDLKTIVESSLVENLNDPSEIEDISWIKPGVAVFPWWSDHFASSDQVQLKKFIDMAAEMKWDWLEFDVALVGTDFRATSQWETTAWIPDLIKYADSKNILVYGWDEMKNLDTPEKRDHIYGKYRDLGIKGIKIDFLDSDSLKAMKFREDALRDAAKYKLMVSFHGETAPRGQRRKWPHMMTQEAVRGAEYYTFEGHPTASGLHNVSLCFARNVIGPMDYTPTTFSAKNRETTYAHELALPVVFESGWTVMADKPEEYLQSPAKDFLQSLHASWDEINFVDGHPDQFVVIARRKGEEWFVGGLNASEPRIVDLDLGFLNAEGQKLKIYGDGAKQSDLKISEGSIQDGRLKVEMKPNGGFCFKVGG